MKRHTLARVTLSLVLSLATLGTCLAGTASAGGDAQITGSGSSWAANAVNQWVADVASSVKVVFTSSGSAQGRKDFANALTDFGVSDIGYQGTDPATGTADTSNGRNYAYLPIVSGGTSFPYQLRVGGQLVTNLRLSGPTLAKIFTLQITNWNDPAITADNNGHAFPSLPIIPVVHTEGSGSTYQFTAYLDSQDKSIWEKYSGGLGATEYFPSPPSGSNMISQSGSDAVINYVTSSAANGAISYDEYSYGLNKGYPAAKVENSAGYFTLPTQFNVAVALTKAIINTDPTSPDYLLQDLSQVYVDPDNRTYPLSSYSYAIIPLAPNDKTMTTGKRQSIYDFLSYSVCDGQNEIGKIGYSALPANLVQASFQQLSKLHDADANVNIQSRTVQSCDNPTFVPGQPDANYLAQTAPQPAACDKAGAGPCTTTDTGTETVVNPNAGGAKAAAAAAAKTSKTTSKAAAAAAQSGTAATTTGSGAAAGGASTATGTTAAGSTSSGTAATSGGTTVDPATGAVVSNAAAGGSAVDPATGQVTSSTGSTAVSGGGTATVASTELAGSRVATSPWVYGIVAIALLLALLVLPPFIAQKLRSDAQTGRQA